MPADHRDRDATRLIGLWATRGRPVVLTAVVNVLREEGGMHLIIDAS